MTKEARAFLGTGKGLNYVGEHAYAYSGVLAIPANDLTTLLKFNTGKSYVVAEWSLSGLFSVAQNGEIHFVLEINGQEVINTKYSGAYDHGYADYPEPIILPPHSLIETKMTHNQGGATIDMSNTITGRVYG